MPTGAISWSQAKRQHGKTRTVCGPFAGTGNSDDDVFLNLGRDYPDAKRFQIVVWDVGGVDSIPSGATVCIRGKISLFRGVAEITTHSRSGFTVYP